MLFSETPILATNLYDLTSLFFHIFYSVFFHCVIYKVTKKVIKKYIRGVKMVVRYIKVTFVTIFALVVGFNING